MLFELTTLIDLSSKLKSIVDDNNKILANFSKPQLAITPGQSIVFYDKNDTLQGGGIIELV